VPLQHPGRLRIREPPCSRQRLGISGWGCQGCSLRACSAARLRPCGCLCGARLGHPNQVSVLIILEVIHLRARRRNLGVQLRSLKQQVVAEALLGTAHRTRRKTAIGVRACQQQPVVVPGARAASATHVCLSMCNVAGSVTSLLSRKRWATICRSVIDFWLCTPRGRAMAMLHGVPRSRACLPQEPAPWCTYGSASHVLDQPQTIAVELLARLGLVHRAHGGNGCFRRKQRGKLGNSSRQPAELLLVDRAQGIGSERENGATLLARAKRRMTYESFGLHGRNREKYRMLRTLCMRKPLILEFQPGWWKDQQV